MTDTRLENEWPGLPEGVASRTLPVRDLDMHFFEVGKPTDPLILLLHGFPELAYSWRKVMLPLSSRGLGYHVVAPDLRGFGRTKPRDPTAPGAARPLAFEDDARPYATLNLVHDVVALVFALGHEDVACLIGHDAGSTIAGYCAVVRPELFKTIVFMSTPWTGPPKLPFDVANQTVEERTSPQAVFPATLVESALAKLDPPRKHYMLYYSGPQANADMWHAPQGLHAFFRGYYHAKSADWPENDTHPIERTPEGLASLPHYYIMPRDATMAQVALADAPSADISKTAKSVPWIRRWEPPREYSGALPSTCQPHNRWGLARRGLQLSTGRKCPVLILTRFTRTEKHNAMWHAPLNLVCLRPSLANRFKPRALFLCTPPHFL